MTRLAASRTAYYPNEIMNPKENLLRAIRRDHPQWVPEGLDGPVYMANVATISAPVVERPDNVAIATPSAWNGRTTNMPRAVRFQRMAAIRFAASAAGDRTSRSPTSRIRIGTPFEHEANAVDRDENLVMGFVQMGLFERSYLLLGMEEALMAFLTDPDDMYDMLGAVADYKIELIRKFDDVIDMDMLWFGDDWGTQQAMFYSTRRLAPRHQAALETDLRLHEGAEIIINQHSCGKIEAVFRDMVDLGADIWNPCQPCNDLARLKHDFGDRICFHGGIDSQFVLHRPGVTPEEVLRGRGA